MEFRNINPLGDVIVGPESTLVPAGGKYEATGDAAERLLEQPENWTRVDKPAAKKPDTTPTDGDK